MLPISTKMEDVNKIIFDDEELEKKINGYYKTKIPDEEIFHREHNMIVTESGFYFALYDNFVTVVE